MTSGPPGGDVFEKIRDLERELGLPEGFYRKLLKDDDWSFVIRLSSLVEAACTHALTHRLHAPELADALAFLSQSARIGMLEDLDAVTKEQARILRRLATLRNGLVHKISNVEFTFTSYLADLKGEELSAFLNILGHGVVDQVEVGEALVSRHDFVRSNPKLATWMTAAEVIACLYLERDIAELRIRTLALDEMKRVLGSVPRGGTR